MNPNLRILVSNDDGIDAPGIFALVTALRSVGHVDVVAPMTQQSAVGHALTVALPLRAIRRERQGLPFGWGVSGTPADCIKLGTQHLLDAQPDLVVSGINHGRNTAVSLIYSGTVSAATEAAVLGIPSIAISLDDVSDEADFSAAALVAQWITPIVAERGLPRGVLLNVNVPRLPASEIRGIRVAPQGESYWNDIYERRLDPMGRPYYWLSGEHVLVGPKESDDGLLSDGYVTLTPVHYRLTEEPMLATMRGWGIESENGLLGSLSATGPAQANR
ncbi:MAG: 5'/3'-nucleotidase SurE [Bacteroidetes bacterium]|nr:5'/3'-nucleotidase SurE [Bacteroidota bacterium]